jgi:hypothetical protein
MKNFLHFPLPLGLFLVLQVVGIIDKPLQADLTEQLKAQDKCLSCHQEMELLPADFQEYDLHLQLGLSCAGCHGGDPTADDADMAMSPQKGFIGIPSKKDIPQFCGKCHSKIDFMRTFQPGISTDQVQQYFTSIHGKKLVTGDKKVAECVSCHTAHGIPSVKDARSNVYPLNVPATCNYCHGNHEYMQEYKIPTDQYEKYTRSVHGQDLLVKKDISAPACNDCHGNHGATPPGLQSVSHVCGNCHVNNLEFFESSPMARPFADLEIHACEQCHGQHDVRKTFDEMTGVGEQSVCTACHTEGDQGYQSAVEMYTSIKALVDTLNEAHFQLREVQKRGMDDVDISFLLQEANQTLIHTRTMVHTFDPVKIAKKSNEGVAKTREAIILANQEIKDYYIRRRGFGIATIFITILVIALFFKIRSMEREKHSS